MKDKNISTGYVILTLLLFGAFVVIGFQMVKIRRLELGRFSVFPGDTLPKLDLIDLDNSSSISDGLSRGVAVLIIFKTPCSECNTNLSSWNSITKFFGNRIKVIGIIPDGNPDAFQLIERKKVNFPLFVPNEVAELHKKMHLRFNMPQTIIVNNNKVIALKTGDLAPEDLHDLMTTIKKLIS